MTLNELKARATELGLTPDDVREFGKLTMKTTWEAAINDFEEIIKQGKSYRLDSSECGIVIWLEELDKEGIPVEDYISVNKEQLKQLKANNQIWNYSSAVERWVPPINATVAKTSTTTDEPIETEQPDTVAKPKIYTLAVEKKWFDMIASSDKKEEYRNITPYFETRFKKHYDYIKFTNGYGLKVPSITVELLGIEKGIPKPEWSEGVFDEGTEVFVLKLGKISQFDTVAQTTTERFNQLFDESEAFAEEYLEQNGELVEEYLDAIATPSSQVRSPPGECA